MGVHGEPWLNIHHRIGSAPRVLSTSQGSNTLPSDLEALRPWASTMCPRHTTWRYGVDPNTSVLTASSE